MRRRTTRAIAKARKCALGGSVGPAPKSERITGEFRDPSERPHGQPWLRPWYMSPRKTEEAAGTRRPDDSAPIVPRVHSIARRADGGIVDDLGTDPIEIERLRVAARGTNDPAQMARNAETNRAFALDNTPVLGNLRAAGRAYDAAGEFTDAAHYGHRDRKRRAMVDFALELPGVLSPLPWGRRARDVAEAGHDTANVLIPALEGPATMRARDMRDSGIQPGRIWSETQRTIAPDGSVRREVRDQAMRVRDDLRPGDIETLDRTISHPALMDAFPQLGSRPVRITDEFDAMGNPVRRTNIHGGFEINPRGDVRRDLAKLLQYEVNKEAGLAQPLRHGVGALERGLDNARLRADALENIAPADRAAVDLYLDNLREAQDQFQQLRLHDSYKRQGARSEPAATVGKRNAGNLDAAAARARATIDPEALKQWPYKRDMPGGKLAAFDDAFALPPNDMDGAALLDFIRRWERYGSGRGKYARGGRVARAVARGKAVTGGIRGKTGGREDALPVDVPAGAYVIPADVVAALGGGNTEAGMHALDKKFGRRRRAAGGRVPILISDGEYVLSPDAVEAAGGNDRLDELVMNTRKAYARHLAELPGPNK